MKNSGLTTNKKSVYKYKNRNISVKLTRKYRKTSDEVAPVFWRITFNRKLKHIFTGFEFSSDDWDDFVNRDLRKHSDCKQTLDRYLRLTLIPAIDGLAEKNSFSFDALDKLINNSPDSIGLNEAFDQKIALLESEYRIGSAGVYKATIKALMRYKYFRQLRNRVDKNAFIALCKGSGI